MKNRVAMMIILLLLAGIFFGCSPKASEPGREKTLSVKNSEKPADIKPVNTDMPSIPGGVRPSEYDRYRNLYNEGKLDRYVVSSVNNYEYLNLEPGESIADIGCGPGFFMEAFSEKAGPGGKVFMVDIDQLSINFIKWRMEKEREKKGADYLKNVELIVNRRDDAMLPPGSINTAFFHHTHNFNLNLIEKNPENPTPEKDWEEFDRVRLSFAQSVFNALRPRGKMVIVEGYDDAFIEKEKVISFIEGTGLFRLEKVIDRKSEEKHSSSYIMIYEKIDK